MTRPTDRVPQRPARGTETVLVVDDEAPVRAMAAYMLGALRYRALEAGSAEEAVRLSASHGRVHLLLTDVRMPGGGGEALTAALAARQPGLKVLWMSGYSEDPAIRRAILEKKVQFLAKPFSMAELAAKVRQVLDAA
jgi:two-component system, cell cycle sensor histidine kinase and response regulator CckA